MSPFFFVNELTNTKTWEEQNEYQSRLRWLLCPEDQCN